MGITEWIPRELMRDANLALIERIALAISDALRREDARRVDRVIEMLIDLQRSHRTINVQ